MQPSEIHLRKELAEMQEMAKNGSAAEKNGAKARIKEIENLLGIKCLEKASIATDEQPE